MGKDGDDQASPTLGSYETVEEHELAWVEVALDYYCFLTRNVLTVVAHVSATCLESECRLMSPPQAMT